MDTRRNCAATAVFDWATDPPAGSALADRHPDMEGEMAPKLAKIAREWLLPMQ